MLARHDGRVVLVAGAIPGERVRVRIEKDTHQVVLAAVLDVLEPSPDRRDPGPDPACGGALYAHMRYERQLACKAEVIADAFRRIGRHAIEHPVRVEASPEHGYRMRARFHVRDGRAGFFREGTHAWCDPAPLRQLHEDALPAVARVLDALGPRAADVADVVVSENVAATERVVHLVVREDGRLGDRDLTPVLGPDCTGVTAVARGRPFTPAGSPTVTDTAATVFGDDPPIDSGLTWIRQAPSFFQANRYLVGALVRRVLDAIVGSRVIDLYAGVGLFALTVAARGAGVVAVEGDDWSVADLTVNARAAGGSVRVVHGRVEAFVATPLDPAPETVIVDPPRTGMSADALAHLLGWAIGRIVYVSCDPPTLARDARRLFESGFRLEALGGFDLFPNTPHVEAVAVFVR